MLGEEAGLQAAEGVQVIPGGLSAANAALQITPRAALGGIASVGFWVEAARHLEGAGEHAFAVADATGAAGLSAGFFGHRIWSRRPGAAASRPYGGAGAALGRLGRSG